MALNAWKHWGKEGRDHSKWMKLTSIPVTFCKSFIAVIGFFTRIVVIPISLAGLRFWDESSKNTTYSTKIFFYFTDHNIVELLFKTKNPDKLTTTHWQPLLYNKPWPSLNTSWCLLGHPKKHWQLIQFNTHQYIFCSFSTPSLPTKYTKNMS